MSLTTPYFSHDINAVSDFKVSSMIMEFGVEGYGLYWVVVESMASTKTCSLPLKDNFIKAIASKCLIKQDDLVSFLERCVDEYELFESDGEYIWSNTLRVRMKKSQDNVDRARKAAEARWGNKSKAKKKTKKAPTKKAKKSIDDRKTEFGESLSSFKGTYSNDMLLQFYEYWTECGDNDKHMRFEKQKTWSLKARLKRWSDNNSNFSRPNKQEGNSQNLFNFGN